MMSLPYPRRPAPAYTTRPEAAATTGAPFLPPMSMPFEASVNGASTLPFTGHIQSTSSRSVPLLSGSLLEGAAAGAGEAGADEPGCGAVDGVDGAADPGAVNGAAAPGSALSCASARSE